MSRMTAAEGDRKPSWIKTLGERFRSVGKPQPEDRRVDSGEAAPTVYCIGDIHGHLDLLVGLESLIKDDMARDPSQSALLVYLGDYVDRGPASSKVIAHLLSRDTLCHQEVFLRGNHEQVLLDALKSPAAMELLCSFGGLDTLVSYGLRPRLPLTPEALADMCALFEAALPPEHLAFFQRTRHSFETATHFFAHAGINPGISLGMQKPADLMWIREPFLKSTRRFEKIVVHGHTPVPQAEIRANRINLDTGAYATGRLSCGVIRGNSCRIISSAPEPV